jgi:branched-chain amino acid transport system permease protein
MVTIARRSSNVRIRAGPSWDSAESPGLVFAPLPINLRSLMHSGAKRFLLAAILVAAVVSYFSAQFNRYYLGLAIDVGINIILAVSLNLINGHTGLFSLGHAGFMAVGGYTAASFTLALAKISPPAAQPFVFVAALVLGGLAAALAGLAVGIPTLRLRGDYLAIVTLGFGEIIRVILQNMDSVGAASGLKGIPEYTNLFWAFALAAVTVFVVTCLVNSTYGRGFIAVHDDEVAASAMGVNPVRYKVTAFVVGAFFAGIAGGLYAHHKQFLSPTGFDFMKSIDIVVMVILGGMGRTAGVIVAAVLLTLLPEWLRMLAQYQGFAWVADSRMIIYALIIIVLMIARPQGLFSFKKR